MPLAINLPLVECLLAVAAQAMQGASSATEQVMGPPAQPTRSITLPFECEVSDVVWSVDSTRAYVSMSVQAADVWPLVVYNWPEIVAIAAGLPLLIILLVLLKRRWRRRHVLAIGEPHCAHCSYQLTGRGDAEVCPECGRELAKGGIVIGRALRRWPVMVIACLLVLIGGAYFLGRSRASRTGAASLWWQWPSVKLYNWATRHNYGVLLHVQVTMRRLVEIDPSTGRPTRTVLSEPRMRRDRTWWVGRLIPGTGPGRLFMTASASASEIELASGKILREYQLPPDDGDPSLGITDIALHPSRPLLYASADCRRVGRWDMGSGDWTQLQMYPTQSQFMMRSLFSLDDADTVILRRVGFEFIDLNTLETVFSQPKPKHDLNQVIGATQGGLLYTFTEFAGSQSVTEQTIMRWSPGMAEAQTLLTIPLRRICEIAQPRESGRIYFSGYPVAPGPQLPIVAVFDPQTATYLQPLESPFIGDMNLAVSPDERWAITWHPEPTTGPALFIFDLQAIHSDVRQSPAD